MTPDHSLSKQKYVLAVSQHFSTPVASLQVSIVPSCLGPPLWILSAMSVALRDSSRLGRLRWQDPVEPRLLSHAEPQTPWSSWTVRWMSCLFLVTIQLAHHWNASAILMVRAAPCCKLSVPCPAKPVNHSFFNSKPSGFGSWQIILNNIYQRMNSYWCTRQVGTVLNMFRIF